MKAELLNSHMIAPLFFVALFAKFAQGKDKDADFDTSKCRDISNDCCVSLSPEDKETAACADGWKVTWEDKSKGSPFESQCCWADVDGCLAKTYTCKHPLTAGLGDSAGCYRRARTPCRRWNGEYVRSK
jgi:hypothetical protein